MLRVSADFILLNEEKKDGKVKEGSEMMGTNICGC